MLFGLGLGVYVKQGDASAENSQTNALCRHGSGSWAAPASSCRLLNGGYDEAGGPLGQGVRRYPPLPTAGAARVGEFGRDGSSGQLCQEDGSTMA